MTRTSSGLMSGRRWVAMCYSVLQRVAVCCSVLQCVAMCYSVLQCVAVYCSALQCVGRMSGRRCAGCENTHTMPVRIHIWGGYD